MLWKGYQFERNKKIPAPKHEKRRYPRLENALLIHIEQDGAVYSGMSTDCSLSGIKLKLSQQIRDHNPIDMEVLLPYEDVVQYENQKPLKLSGRIAWSEKKGKYYFYGINFSDLDIQQEAGLRKIFAFFNMSAEFC